MVITSMFAAAVAMYKMVLEQRLQIPANWLLFNSLVMVALTVPTVTVTIIDRVTGLPWSCCKCALVICGSCRVYESNWRCCS